MRVAILGDIHGNTEYLDYALTQAELRGAEVMIQVGDFGFNFNEKFLQNLEAVLNVHQLPLYAIRGNHDNPRRFDKYNRLGWLNLIPDGLTARMGSKRVAFLGGAVSIDRDWREENVSWWADERVNPAIVNKWMLENTKADVLISHEAPLRPSPLPNFMIKPDIQRDCVEDRDLLKMAVSALEPEVVYHGHYHVRDSRSYFQVDGTKVLLEGLSSDSSPLIESMVIVDF